MIPALTAALAIVVLDHSSLRTAPSSSAAALTALGQGDLVEVRGQSAGYLKVYDYYHERGGYLKGNSARQVDLTEAGAPELLAVLRFLREGPGSEALGIGYGAAYLRAVPARALTAEPFDAIARMAERLADRASGSDDHFANFAAPLDVVQQYGIRMRSFESNGRMQLCYDGELYRRVLAMPSANPEQRAGAALGLTRPDCIDPDLSPTARAALDDERRQLLDDIEERDLGTLARTRLHARRAGVWASIAFERARRGEPPDAAGKLALDELLGVRPNDLGEDYRSEYLDAVLRVSAVRWSAAPPAPRPSSLVLSAAPGDPGQTCVSLQNAQRPQAAPLLRRCTYGIVWTASAQLIPQGPALVLAVQPAESWRELWVFHQKGGTWIIDVLVPGAEDAEQGYVDFAGYAPAQRRLLIARELREHGRFRRHFEELRLEDLALVRQASTPELLRDFGRWQDATWRRDTLVLH
jgi:hypothetical protein